MFLISAQCEKRIYLHLVYIFSNVETLLTNVTLQVPFTPLQQQKDYTNVLADNPNISWITGKVGMRKISYALHGVIKPTETIKS